MKAALVYETGFSYKRQEQLRVVDYNLLNVTYYRIADSHHVCCFCLRNGLRPTAGPSVRVRRTCCSTCVSDEPHA